MQLEYIENLSKAYVIDNRLYEGANVVTEGELSENFYNAIKSLRTENPELYENFLTSNKFEQQKIFKTYFDLAFESGEDVFVDLDEITDNISSEIEPLQEGFISATGAVLGAIWKIAEAVYKFVNGIFSWYGLIVFIFILIHGPSRRAITRAVIKSIIGIFSTIGKIGKACSKFSDSARISYSIITNNANKCLQKCGYDPKKAGPSDFLYQAKQGSWFRDFGRVLMSIEKEDKLQCIRECYLDTLSESVKLVANLYFQCLKNTGDLSKLPLERDFDAYQKIIVKTNINMSCDEFMGSLSDALGAFDESLNLIYADEPTERRKRRLDLMNDIYQMQKKEVGSNNRPDNRSSNFQNRPNNKYQQKKY